MRMCAMTVVPGQKRTAGIEEVRDPRMQDGALLVRGMAAGICGTDREIAEGTYGAAQAGWLVPHQTGLPGGYFRAVTISVDTSQSSSAYRGSRA